LLLDETRGRTREAGNEGESKGEDVRYGTMGCVEYSGGGIQNITDQKR
jgi:hypothetical protein